MSGHDITFPDPGERLADWLRRLSAKEVARVAHAEPRTVNAWRQQQSFPGIAHLSAMFRAWGWPFLFHLFGRPAETDATYERRLCAIEAQLAALSIGQDRHREDRFCILDAEFLDVTGGDGGQARPLLEGPMGRGGEK